MKYFVSELKDNMFECSAGILIDRKHIARSFVEKYAVNKELVSCITSEKVTKALNDKYNLEVKSVEKTPYVVLSEDNDIVLVKAVGHTKSICELNEEELAAADFSFVIYKAEKKVSPEPEEKKGFFRKRKKSA